ncbi:MAG: nucleotidyltransferase domain-containing protein [Bacteroidota bacterium]
MPSNPLQYISYLVFINFDQKSIEGIQRICSLLKVKTLQIFGSAASNTDSSKSDIDFLLEFREDLNIEEYTNNYFQLHYRLKELLNRDIDLTTKRTLKNPYLIESINRSKRVIYEA